MSIKSFFSIFILLALVFIGACTTNTKKSSAVENNKLIAQALPVEEEKVPTINEIISRDIGFTKLKEVIASSDFTNIFSDKGPYTIFAPANGAFLKLPKGGIEKLIAPENKEKLIAIMNCHIIRGLINEQDILKAIDEGRGSVKLKTLGGTRLIASLKKGKIYLIDKNGN